MVDFTAMPWLHSTAKKEAAKDHLKTADMIGDVVAIVAIAVVLLYFINSHTTNRGFFTEKFGGLEAFFFYGVAIVGFLPPALRLYLRKRNVARPLEIVNSIFAIVSIVYLLGVFPFDFTHLASSLPSSIQSILTWLTDDVARLLMTVGAILAAFITAWTFLLYIAVRKVLEVQTIASSIEKH